jgi:outer membrane immunogenic protein
MSVRKLFLFTAFFTASCSSYAEDPSVSDTGWFVGGTLGQATSSLGRVDSTDNSFGLYGGYNFTPWFGLEGSFISADRGTDKYNEVRSASIGGFTVTPKLTFVINNTVSLYAKAGLSALAYVVEEYDSYYYDGYDYDYDYDYGYNYGNDSSWAGLGTTFGVGAEFRLVKGLKLRISYDQASATLENDSRYYSFDIDAKISQTSLGLHYQF